MKPEAQQAQPGEKIRVPGEWCEVQAPDLLCPPDHTVSLLWAGWTQIS